MCRRCQIEARMQASGKRKRRALAQMVSAAAEEAGYPLPGWQRRAAFSIISARLDQARQEPGR